jgi:hypothetical protein
VSRPMVGSTSRVRAETFPTINAATIEESIGYGPRQTQSDGITKPMQSCVSWAPSMRASVRGIAAPSAPHRLKPEIERRADAAASAAREWCVVRSLLVGFKGSPHAVFWPRLRGHTFILISIVHEHNYNAIR